MSGDGPVLVPGDRFAGHVIGTELGRGGMGHVYRATREADGAEVALKLLPPELSGEDRYRKRFARESRLAASLSHAHLVPVVDAGEHEGSLWIAMELIEGPDLGAVLTERGTIHPGNAARIVAQVGGGLDAAARAGLVHRDVKPANVFVVARDGAPHAYLGDFGLTKATDSQSGLTATGKFLGTVAYAAPEQAQGDEVGPATDVYQLGGLLYRALSGVQPFPRPRQIATIMAHIREPPPKPSEANPACPPALDRVVATAMAKKPRKRYPSASALGEAALEGAAGAGPPPAWPETG
ncbi:MAG TPA: serine/threonine-protein kinase [Thermoleophilaceae bacterium]|nr:serine/threonine-protein kinase [Thermoleophilaceae bacterium]